MVGHSENPSAAEGSVLTSRLLVTLERRVGKLPVMEQYRKLSARQTSDEIYWLLRALRDYARAILRTIMCSEGSNYGNANVEGERAIL